MVEHIDTLKQLNTRIVVVSFVQNDHWARIWKEENQFSFPLLLDRDKGTYQAFGLMQSVAGSWSPRVLWFYTKAFLTGRKLKGIKGDPNQLGGDILIDTTGRVRYIYRSRDSLDRPEIEDLFAEMRKIDQ